MASVRVKPSGCSHGRWPCGNEPRPPGSSPRSRKSRQYGSRWGRRTSADGHALWTSQSMIATPLTGIPAPADGIRNFDAARREVGKQLLGDAIRRAGDAEGGDAPVVLVDRRGDAIESFLVLADRPRPAAAPDRLELPFERAVRRDRPWRDAHQLPRRQLRRAEREQHLAVRGRV